MTVWPLPCCLLGKRGAALLPQSLPSNDLTAQSWKQEALPPWLPSLPLCAAATCHTCYIPKRLPDPACAQGGSGDALKMLLCLVRDPHTAGAQFLYLHLISQAASPTSCYPLGAWASLPFWAQFPHL